MNTLNKLLMTGVLIVATTACKTTSNYSAFPYKEGDIVQALANIHPDNKGNRIDSLNYQLATTIPVCSEFTINSIGGKAVTLTSNNTTYTYLWNGHTRKAGQSLNDSFQLFFGDKCNSEKIDKLSKIDKEGIKKGTALIGMSKEGVLFAMGRPPIHANPSTESNTWLYWRNRFGKRAVEFSPQGKVINIR